MTTKAIGFYLEPKTGELRRGESSTRRVPIYETRNRNGHTQAKVFDKSVGDMTWKTLPIEADPQHTKDAALVLAATF